MSAFENLAQALRVLRNRTGLDFALESGNGKRKLVLRSSDNKYHNEREFTGYWPAAKVTDYIEAFIDGFEAGKESMANELLYPDDKP